VGGGGRKDLAEGGGKSPEKLAASLAQVCRWWSKRFEL